MEIPLASARPSLRLGFPEPQTWIRRVRTSASSASQFCYYTPHESDNYLMSVNTQISTDIDYEKNGKQFGMLGVPQSLNTSGWATLFVPIAVVKNGTGPTAVVFGGNHGDEYEGQVTLMN